MIKRETIDKIFETSRIEEVIGEFVNLKKTGANFKGLSPFTNEKTPSFVVSPSKQIFKCFSSGKGGNVVTFLMEAEHFTYPEALKWLADKYQIEIEETVASPEAKAERDEKESIFALSAFADQFYQDQLHNTEEGKGIGLSYFQQRGFTPEIIKSFGLGYSPEKRNAFTEYAEAKGYQKEFLELSGLSIYKNGPGFDRFSGRVMFPIHSMSGRVLGFGGRILKSNTKAAKYLNSPENPIYHKSKVLYGIYQARQSIAKADLCYLVEGYTDVISLHQAGITQAVASSGTALTPDQIRMVSRLTKNLTILYDGDAAGIKAAIRGTHIALEQGMHVRVVLFPEGEDPDSFAQKNSLEDLEKFLKESAKDIVQFQTDLALDQAKGDPIRKSELLKEILETISLVKEDTLQTLYIQETSRKFEVDERRLFNELARIQGKKEREDARKENREQLRAVTDTPKEEPKKNLGADHKIFNEDQEKSLIRILISCGADDMEYHPPRKSKEDEEEVLIINVAKFIVQELQADDMHFHHPLFAKVYDEILDGIEAGEIPDSHFFTRHENPEIAQLASDLITEKYHLSENWKSKGIFIHPRESYLSRDVFESLYYFKKGRVKETLKTLTEKLRKSDNSPEQSMEIMSQMKQLKFVELAIANLINEKHF